MKQGKVKSLMRMLISGVMLLVIAAGCSNTPASGATGIEPSSINPPPNGTGISIIPSTNNLKAGESFSADIYISSDSISRGVQCGLTFTPGILHCDQVETNDMVYDPWAKENNAQALAIGFPPDIDNENGVISVVGTALAGAQGKGVQGSGTYCTIHFTALTEGTGELVLDNVQLVDLEGKVIMVPVNDGKVVVSK